jgi:hypothetical protein
MLISARTFGSALPEYLCCIKGRPGRWRLDRGDHEVCVWDDADAIAYFEAQVARDRWDWFRAMGEAA